MFASGAALFMSLFLFFSRRRFLSAVTDGGCGEPEIRINAGKGKTEARLRDLRRHRGSPLGN